MPGHPPIAQLTEQAAELADEARACVSTRLHERPEEIELVNGQILATLAVERQLAACAEGLDLIAYILGEMERRHRPGL